MDLRVRKAMHVSESVPSYENVYKLWLLLSCPPEAPIRYWTSNGSMRSNVSQSVPIYINACKLSIFISSLPEAFIGILNERWIYRSQLVCSTLYKPVQTVTPSLSSPAEASIRILDERGVELREKFYREGSTMELQCLVADVPTVTALQLAWYHHHHRLNYDDPRGGVRWVRVAPLSWNEMRVGENGLATSYLLWLPSCCLPL